MKVDDDKKLEILAAMEMEMEMMAMMMILSRCENLQNLVAGIKRRMDGSGYRKMHLVHLGGFKVQTPTNGDGDALLHCGADNALKGSHK